MNEELETTTDNEQTAKPATDYLWLVCCTLVTAVASFVRFFWLELKPLHHDEGVNGYFLTNLFRSGEYKYDPANYHGPDLYYIALAFSKVFGLNTLSIRWSVAVFGVMVVVLAFFLRRYIGRTGALFAAFFLALSPGMSYISRYFIHEMLFVFFSFGIVVAILCFIERKRAGIGAILWTSLLLLVCFLPSALNLANVIENSLKVHQFIADENAWVLWTLRVLFFLIEAALVFFVMRMLLAWREGQPIYLLLASASTVLLFATKETAFITLGTMVIAVACVWLWRMLASAESKLLQRFYGGAISLLFMGLVVNWIKFKHESASKYLVYLLIIFGLSWLIAWALQKFRSSESALDGNFLVFLPLSAVTLAALLINLLLERAEYSARSGSMALQGEDYSAPWTVPLYAGLKTVYDNFAATQETAQIDLFYGIVVLCALAAAAWIIFVLFNRAEKTSDPATQLTGDPDEMKIDLDADRHLTWENFRARTTAADTWEFAIVGSAVLGAAIAVVWFFVRYAIDVLIAWKAEKSVSAALGKIDLSKVDFGILMVAFLLLAFAGILWQTKKPPKISNDLVLMTIAVAIVFLYVGALFFSSFFTYPEGLKAAFEAYDIWTKTGTKDHTQNGFWAYVRWGMIIEAPILALSALGTLIAFYKARHRFAMFAGLWALGLFAAYTIIPYKTPWLALSFLLPMCIVAGYGVGELLNSRKLAEKIAGGVLAVGASVILAFQTYEINFVRYDDDRMPYIYAHTRRGFLDLIKQIEYYADKSGQGKQAKIEIVSPDYWSMPWYMNDYPNAVFQGKPIDVNSAEMIVAKKDEQDAEIVSRYAIRYRVAGEYPLRPGVDLVLLVRRDIADSDTKDIYAVFGEPFNVTPDETETPLETTPVGTPNRK